MKTVVFKNLTEAETRLLHLVLTDDNVKGSLGRQLFEKVSEPTVLNSDEVIDLHEIIHSRNTEADIETVNTHMSGIIREMDEQGCFDFDAIEEIIKNEGWKEWEEEWGGIREK